MRINIYAEELREVIDKYGSRVTLIHKGVVEGFKHSAIQMLVGERIIHTENEKSIDDDTSAVKFWYSDEYTRGLLIKMFEAALVELHKPEAKK